MGSPPPNREVAPRAPQAAGGSLQLLNQTPNLQEKHFNRNVNLIHTINIIQLFENSSRLTHGVTSVSPALCAILLPVAGVILPLFVPNNKGTLLHQIAFHTPPINSVVPPFLRIQSDKLTTTSQLVHKLG